MKSETILKSDEYKEFPVGVFSQGTYLPRLHHHVEYELFYLDRGSVQLKIEKDSFELKEGDCFFLEPEKEHCVIGQRDSYHYYALVFEASIIGSKEDSCRTFFESIKIHRFLKLSAEMITKIKESVDFIKKDDKSRNFIIKALLYEIISYIIQTKQFEYVSSLANIKKISISAIDNAINFIHNHFKENIDFEDVQKESDYSKSHFTRLFKETTGMSFTEYLNKYRTEKACLDLIYTKKNITEIASENGFNNIQYFSRVFRHIMGCTPKEYQKKAVDVIVPSTIPDAIL